MAPPVTPPEIRFWRYVDKHGPISSLGTRCWMWTGAKGTCPNGDQYGRFRVSTQRMAPPHRFAYEMLVCPTDADAVDHLCRNTLCVNPAHLEPVTDRTNILRGVGPAAKNAAKIGCIRGHGPFDIITPKRRDCSRCRTERDRQQRANKAAA